MGLTAFFSPKGLHNKAQGRGAHPGYRMGHAKRTLYGFHSVSRGAGTTANRRGGVVEPPWGPADADGARHESSRSVPRVRSATLGFDVRPLWGQIKTCNTKTDASGRRGRSPRCRSSWVIFDPPVALVSSIGRRRPRVKLDEPGQDKNDSSGSSGRSARSMQPMPRRGRTKPAPGQRPGEKRDSKQQQALKRRYKSRAARRHGIAINERFVGE